MAVVNWSSEARQDLHDIRDYYESRSPQYAQEIVGELLEAGSRLEAFPRMGRKVPELESATFREVIVEDYRLVYMVHGEREDATVDVLALAHARQDLRKKLSRRN